MPLMQQQETMDAECFKKQFLPYHRQLYNQAVRLLENATDAEDVVQEAYLKLWDKRDSLNNIDNPRAFCLTLVRNMCLDLLRSTRYNWQRQQTELPDNLQISAPDDTEARENVQIVQQIIDSLPEQQQRIVDLRDVKGYTYEEIEQLTGMTATNIRVVLSRARKKIREAFFKQQNYEKRRD